MTTARLLLNIALALAPSSAFACLCSDPQLEELLRGSDHQRQAAYILKKADVVVLGVVTHVETVPRDATALYQVATIKPLSEFKGNAATLHAYIGSGMCGATFRVGRPFTYFAMHDDKRRAWIDACLHGRVEHLFPVLNKYLDGVRDKAINKP